MGGFFFYVKKLGSLTSYPGSALNQEMAPYSVSAGHGTVTRLPQLTQVPSRKYQTISLSSKEAIMLKTWEPQGQTCIGPSSRRSLPNTGGNGLEFLDRVGRRSQRSSPVVPLSRPARGRTPCLIRLTAHIVAKPVACLW